MDIKSINLRKCIIKRLSEDTSSLIVQDLYDDSEKVVFLTGKQRMFYSTHKLGDIIYTAKDVKWRLVHAQISS